jgi:hypothetical protein
VAAAIVVLPTPPLPEKNKYLVNKISFVTYPQKEEGSLIENLFL